MKQIDDEEFNEMIREMNENFYQFAKLVSSYQQPLGREFEKVLYDNLWELLDE